MVPCVDASSDIAAARRRFHPRNHLLFGLPDVMAEDENRSPHSCPLFLRSAKITSFIAHNNSILYISISLGVRSIAG
jgi:hypothetical protein